MQCDFKYADLLDDDVFKLVFGQESSKDVMVEFLNQVITDRNIVDLDFMDKEMRPSERGKKKSIYDMFCWTDDGSRIVVEVQRRKQPFYVERSIYYSTFQVRNQVDAGREEYSFYPVYVISILDFNIEENAGNPEVKTVYRLYEENNHNLLTDRLTFIYLELCKFTKTAEELDGNVLDGMYFCLKNMSRLDKCPEKLNHGVFLKMFQISELWNMDEDIRSKVIEKMNTERDLRNQMAYAKRQAIAEGKAEGREIGLAIGKEEGLAEGRAEGLVEGRAEGLVEGRAEIIRQLLKSGMAIEVISEALNLSEEEIRKITDISPE